MRNEFTAIIEEAEEGGYWAYCPEVPAANGQGETLDEVLEDLAAAIAFAFEIQRDEASRSASATARTTTVVVG